MHVLPRVLSVIEACMRPLFPVAVLLIGIRAVDTRTGKRGDYDGMDRHSYITILSYEGSIATHVDKIF
jgi:hypothetical protein